MHIRCFARNLVKEHIQQCHASNKAMFCLISPTIFFVVVIWRKDNLICFFTQANSFLVFCWVLLWGRSKMTSRRICQFLTLPLPSLLCQAVTKNTLPPPPLWRHAGSANHFYLWKSNFFLLFSREARRNFIEAY